MNSVRRNVAQSRFELTVDGATAIAEYHDREGVMVLPHTFVPPALRGRGVAALLIRTALETARREGRKVDPQCSYVARFIARYPEYRDLV